MKILSFLLPIAVVAVASCSSEPGATSVDVNKTAMSFHQEGADFGECRLVSQFEKGRASASQAAGGG